MSEPRALKARLLVDEEVVVGSIGRLRQE